MTFAEKLRELRKKAGMSQEQLAERLGVSRQAVTKWETGSGIPDIENIMAVSALFSVSVDELISNEKITEKPGDFLFESVTEYDIDELKRFDMKLGGMKKLVIRGHDGEKLRVRLASDTLSELQRELKVKIDDIRKRIDVDVIRGKGVTEAAAREAVTGFIALPKRYLGKLEAAVNAEAVEISSLESENIELDVRTGRLVLDNVTGTVEINCNSDMDIICRTLSGAVEVNQLSAVSRISVPLNTPFSAAVKGIGTSISYEKNGKPSEPFCSPDADNMIGLNGMKSELIICTEE